MFAGVDCGVEGGEGVGFLREVQGCFTWDGFVCCMVMHRGFILQTLNSERKIIFLLSGDLILSFKLG